MWCTQVWIQPGLHVEPLSHKTKTQRLGRAVGEWGGGKAWILPSTFSSCPQHFLHLTRDFPEMFNPQKSKPVICHWCVFVCVCGVLACERVVWQMPMRTELRLQDLFSPLTQARTEFRSMCQATLSSVIISATSTSGWGSGKEAAGNREPAQHSPTQARALLHTAPWRTLVYLRFTSLGLLLLLQIREKDKRQQTWCTFLPYFSSIKNSRVSVLLWESLSSRDLPPPCPLPPPIS